MSNKDGEDIVEEQCPDCGEHLEDCICDIEEEEEDELEFDEDDDIEFEDETD